MLWVFAVSSMRKEHEDPADAQKHMVFESEKEKPEEQPEAALELYVVCVAGQEMGLQVLICVRQPACSGGAQDYLVKECKRTEYRAFPP